MLLVIVVKAVISGKLFTTSYTEYVTANSRKVKSYKTLKNFQYRSLAVLYIQSYSLVLQHFPIFG